MNSWTIRLICIGAILGLTVVVIAANIVAEIRHEWPHGDRLPTDASPPSKQTGYPRYTAYWYALRYGVVGGLFLGGIVGWLSSLALASLRHSPRKPSAPFQSTTQHDHGR